MKSSLITPQGWNPPSIFECVSIALVCQVEDAVEISTNVCGWLEHEIDDPLPWQDGQSCQEVVFAQGNLTGM